MMMVTAKSISVILPAYNEADGIALAIREIDAYVSERFADYEIIVVSEGSTDATVEAVRELTAHMPRLKLFFKKEWTGMAGAVRTGYAHASKDLIFYTDADRQFDINELDLLLPLIERYDMVTGYKLKRHDPLMRLLMSRLYNIAMRLLFDIRVKDINCAFKLYRRQVIRAVEFIPGITEGIVNVEIFLSAKRNGFTVAEVGVHHFPRRTGSAISEVGFSKLVFVNPKVAFRFLKDTIRIWRKFHRI